MLQHRIDTRPRIRNAGRPAEKSAPAFLKWLRGRSCYLAGSRGHECSGKVRASHVDHAGGKGVGTKVTDRHAIPMCDGAHGEQHRIGWPAFQVQYGIEAVSAAEEFWQAWPGRAAWERARA
jgi:hypothetical protein